MHVKQTTVETIFHKLTSYRMKLSPKINFPYRGQCVPNCTLVRVGTPTFVLAYYSMQHRQLFSKDYE